MTSPRTPVAPPATADSSSPAARDRTGPLLSELSTHTHFFRGEAELAEALDELAARAARGRTPRLWCAGCSTGAEPYSLAILCVERSIDAVIHATDLNAAALAAARAARYPEIALRCAPPHLCERHFERDGADYVVRPHIVQRITFERSDLRTDPLPCPPSADGEVGWDVIVCRNVLIYYDTETAGAIAARFATALRPDGVLIVGSTDPLAFRSPASLRFVRLGGVASYARVEPVVRPLWEEPAASAEFGAPPRLARGEPSCASPHFGAPEGDLPALLAEACGRLAAHAWDEAEGALLRAEELAPLAPEPPLYLGVLRRKQGRFDEAVALLRRAVFLSPRCWIASYLLAGAWERLGDRARARLELERTLETLGVIERTGAPLELPIGADLAGLSLDVADVTRACRARVSAG